MDNGIGKWGEDIGKCLKCKTGDISRTKGMWCEKCVEEDQLRDELRVVRRQMRRKKAKLPNKYGERDYGNAPELPLYVKLELELVESRNK